MARFSAAISVTTSFMRVISWAIRSIFPAEESDPFRPPYTDSAEPRRWFRYV